jgi:hypothetical protein
LIRTLRRADAAIELQSTRHDAATQPNVGVAVMPAPVRFAMQPEVDELKVPRIEIVCLDERQVVTVIELLSPINKRYGVHRTGYGERRKALLYSNANFLEIDLLRLGGRMDEIAMPQCDYAVVLHRTSGQRELEAWPIDLREPLPVVPVPLHPPDTDLPLDWKAALHATYDSAHYENYLYDRQPEPPLRREDHEWARIIIAQAAPR